MTTPSIRFLADESLEYSLVLYLREIGYDVVSVAQDSPSIKDEAVLAKAQKEKRILLTNDKDFGDLIFLSKLKHAGIILFRFKNEKILHKQNAINLLLKNHKIQLSNAFVVVEDDKIRIRK